MELKENLARFAHDAASNPVVGSGVATATTSVGLSTYFGWVERGVGLMAAMMGLMVTVALWRKLRLERQETELRIKALQDQLAKDHTAP